MTVTLSIPRASVKTATLKSVPRTIIGAKPKKPDLAALAAAIQKTRT